MNKLTPLFLALAIGFGTFGFYQQQQAAQLRAQLVAVQSAEEQRKTEAAEAARIVEQMKGQATAQKAVIVQLEARNKELAGNPSAAPAAGQKEGEGKPENSFMKGLSKMFSDPKTRDAMRAQHGAQVNLMYGGLAQELALPPEVARQVLALLSDRQADVAAKAMAAMGRDGRDMTAVGKESEEVKKTYDEQIKAVLGEAGFSKFTEYEKSIGDRVALDQIQRQLSASGTTLDGAQQKGLLNIMREERERTKTPSATTNNQAEAAKLVQDDASVDKWLNDQQEMNRRVVDRARDVLSADQLVAFEAAQKQFLEMQKMGVQMSRQFFQKK